MRNFLWHVVGVVVVFGGGVGFAQYVKDFLKGIPAEVRAELQKAETAARAKLAGK